MDSAQDGSEARRLLRNRKATSIKQCMALQRDNPAFVPLIELVLRLSEDRFQEVTSILTDLKGRLVPNE